MADRAVLGGELAEDCYVVREGVLGDLVLQNAEAYLPRAVEQEAQIRLSTLLRRGYQLCTVAAGSCDYILGVLDLAVDLVLSQLF